MIENMVIIAVVLGIIGASIGYIVHAKKSGKKCIGCPECGSCSKKCCK